MLYVKESQESIEQVLAKLEAAATEHRFGILAMHDLKERMIAKGVSFDHECRVLEVCNPVQAKKVLDADISIANALPCRICVYEQGGKVCVSTIRPTFMLDLFHNEELLGVAKEVEDTMVRIIDASCR